MIEIKAPHPYTKTDKMVFLAGSIEMGKAVDWQTSVAAEILRKTDYTVLNPRRNDWDSSWKQTIENPQFREQVEWELQAMSDATKIIMFFQPGTMSPISLLELGLFSQTGKLIVICEEGFWRKGNVDIVCKRYGIKMAPSLLDALDML